MEHAGTKPVLNLQEGEIILVDKPLDWTSFDIVARMRAMFEVKKIGHAGTLDPKATGLLIICTGKKTKSIDSFMGWEKEYTGIIELGSTTKSFDTETEVVKQQEVGGLSQSQISHCFREFIGVQQQLPPMYSAIKMNGRRLYKDARKGRDIERPTREVEIKEFEMTSFALPSVGFRVVCSKGTYIRSLANDVGVRLGCGAYLKELRRTRIGEFSVGDALPVELLHTITPRIVQEPAAV